MFNVGIDFSLMGPRAGAQATGVAMGDVVFDGFACRLPSMQLPRYGVVGSERRRSRRTETIEAPAAGLRKLAHYRHTIKALTGADSVVRIRYKLLIQMVPGAGLEPALTLR